MVGSFLDTTVVVSVADKADPGTKAFIAANPPAAVAHYALRELLAGHLAILCDVHNRVKAADSIAEVLVALVAVNPIVGRKKQAALQAFAEAFRAQVAADPHRNIADIGKELAGDLALRIGRAWNRSRRLQESIQPLACFIPGNLTYGNAGDIKGPGGSFGCDSRARCAAADYLHSDEPRLSRLIAALHPDRLSADLANKNETQQRRKALKELREGGPRAFNKKRCRALGDAYFAGMCPIGFRVVTTNQADFVPLCRAVGCALVVP